MSKHIPDYFRCTHCHSLLNDHFIDASSDDDWDEIECPVCGHEGTLRHEAYLYQLIAKATLLDNTAKAAIESADTLCGCLESLVAMKMNGQFDVVVRYGQGVSEMQAVAAWNKALVNTGLKVPLFTGDQVPLFG